MNSSRKLLPLVQLCARQFSTGVARKQAASTTEELPKRILKLRANQKRFGVDDGVPVYLKAGLRDKLLFQFTVILLVIGLGMSAETFYKLMKK